ncbi:hypothetical protein AO372_1049 [Moraxella catarrhalis]|nr:hypothetical protein MCR_1645 [Moraxella catarrhalis BBH18]AZQ88350.1 hypothetical protein EJK50_1783 [Moraxella catarrhalis]OAV21135.1 hypothetical protein AO372_1049 [Moraxella catarrhalis]
MLFCHHHWAKSDRIKSCLAQISIDTLIISMSFLDCVMLCKLFMLLGNQIL